MTMQLWEPVVKTLRQRLETNLPTHIADINAAQTDPLYPIENPQRVLDYIPPVADLYALPCVGISDGPLTFQDDVGWGATGVFELTVVVFLQSADQRQLVWQLRRYAQAIIRAVDRGSGLDEGWGVTLRNVRPGPSLGRDTDPKQWLSTVAVTVVVKTEQDG